MGRFVMDDEPRRSGVQRFVEDLILAAAEVVRRHRAEREVQREEAARIRKLLFERLAPAQAEDAGSAEGAVDGVDSGGLIGPHRDVPVRAAPEIGEHLAGPFDLRERVVLPRVVHVCCGHGSSLSGRTVEAATSAVGGPSGAGAPGGVVPTVGDASDIHPESSPLGVEVGRDAAPAGDATPAGARGGPILASWLDVLARRQAAWFDSPSGRRRLARLLGVTVDDLTAPAAEGVEYRAAGAREKASA